jgi:hypothetical protein
MATRRVFFACLLAVGLPPGGLAAQSLEPRPTETLEQTEEPAFTPLASLTFDRGSDSGPDTFRVWEQQSGPVTRTREFRWSGDYSLELRDVRGDGDFPELLGFFPLRRSGQVFVHFAILVTDPRDEFNVALIGPEGFTLEKDGFAVWLSARDGFLRHLSDSIPKRLLRLEPFTWYQVDLLYDVERGTYTLSIEEEGASAPAVQLVDQANAAHHPGSAVDKFSFVTDPFTDLSKAVYYVDDIVIGADEALELPPFVAPGRRRLFVEMMVDDLRARVERAAAVEATAVDRWTELILGGDHALAYRYAQGQRESGDGTTSWLERAGDAALLDGDASLALELYRAATKAGAGPDRLLLKRADAHFLLGDVDEEKRLRERIYGSIEPLHD